MDGAGISLANAIVLLGMAAIVVLIGLAAGGLI